MCCTYSVQYITVGSEGCLPVFLIYFGLSLCLLTPYTPPSPVSSGENWGVAATCFDRSVDIFKGPCLTMCALYWQLARGSLYELLIEVCGWRFCAELLCTFMGSNSYFFLYLPLGYVFSSFFFLLRPWATSCTKQVCGNAKFVTLETAETPVSEEEVTLALLLR